MKGYFVCGFKKSSFLLEDIRSEMYKNNIRFALITDNLDYQLQITNPDEEVIKKVCEIVRKVCDNVNSYYYAYLLSSDMKFYNDLTSYFFSDNELMNMNIESYSTTYTDKDFVRVFELSDTYNFKTLGSRYGDSLI